ncbi:MAG: peptidylprolyl isomerase, partial [Chloroflexi bacterium]|nr:peptidylprolyl isomerase [Chloroflexota bacterium]
MTFRAKPVVKRAQKPSWESRDRRNFYLNLGFAIVVAAAVLILLVAVALSYYNDHLVSVGSVGGQAITKDELRDRVLVEGWRLDEADRRIDTQKALGHLTQAQADSQSQVVGQQREQLVLIALERIIDTRIQAGLATTEGVAVTDADIDARLIEEATTPETRHVWLIEVAPVVDPDKSEPTAAQIAAARTKIDTALRDLQGGKAWEEVAMTVSTDASTAPQAGDLGWLGTTDGQGEQAFVDAVFAAELNTPTPVIEGEDGTFRIGRVTEIAPESVNEAYQDSIVNDGVDFAKYRGVVRGDVVRKKLEDKVVADAIKPGPQREVNEIYLRQQTVDLPPEAVKVRHILYSPKDDPGGAQDGTIPATDPSWAQAKTDAFAAHVKLQADPSQFDAIARAESDEESALGPGGSGGKLDGYVSTDSSYVESFSTPILAANTTDSQILPPIQTEFGWHIVQVLNHAPDLAAIKAQVDGGADFATLARDFSEGSEASRGGDIGWVARGQLDEVLGAAIFATEKGKTSEVVTVADDGQYLFQVIKEEERTPEGLQLDEIRARAFSAWYDPKKAAVDVTRDEAIDT